MPQAYERSYIEAAVTITFLTLALAFEKVWHHLYHLVKKSHHSDEAAPEDLFLDLMNRAGGEFMTLGFLAFCIFLFNTVGGFKLCVKTIHDAGMSLPVSEGEWLHLAEVVHMQLFLGMIIYFAVISRTVRGAVAKLRHWGKSQALCRGMAAGPARTILPLDKDLQEYSEWLYFFNLRMLLRGQPNRLEFADLFTELDIDWTEVDYTEKLRTLLVEDFNFYRYLALNVSSGIRDSIQIHTKTWLVMIVLFMLFGLLHRYAHWTMYNLMPAFVVAAILILLVMHAFVRRKMANLRRRTRLSNEEAVDLKMEFVQVRNSIRNSCKSEGSKNRPLHERLNTEVIVIRILQVMLFLISYILARVLVSAEEWQSDPIQSLIFALVLSAILLLVTHWLPKSVPLFLAIRSMPPYVDDDNFGLFCDVLLKCTKEQEMLAMVHATSQRKGSKASSRSKGSKARSDIGASISETGTGVVCQNNTRIGTHVDTFPSEEVKENQWNDFACSLVDAHTEPPESESPGLVVRMASVK